MIISYSKVLICNLPYGIYAQCYVTIHAGGWWLFGLVCSTIFFSVPTTDNYPYPSLRNLQFVLREKKRDVFNTQQGDFFFLLCVRVHNDNQRVVVVVVVVAAVLHVA